MKVYSYKGKLYSDEYWKDPIHSKYDGGLDMLIDLLSDDEEYTGLGCNCTTVYYLDGEFIGTDNDLGASDILDIMFENGYDKDIGLKEIEK